MKVKLRQLYRVMLADKKKAGLVLGLLAVGLLLWGRLLLKQVPRTATADPNQKQSAVDASQKRSTITQTEKVVELALSENFGRDLFSFHPEGYTRLTDVPITESGTDDSDVTAQKQARIEAVRIAARRLSLQSVVQGEQPRAFINGQLIAPGQTVEGFLLKQVTDRYAVLEMNGVEIRLGM